MEINLTFKRKIHAFIIRSWKKLFVFSIIFIFSSLSANNFINNDNYFPLAYLYLIDYPDFFTNLSSFLPNFFPEIIIKPFFYLFITPLSSTYAPLVYVFYSPIILLSSTKLIFLYTLGVTLIINSVILNRSFNIFQELKKVNLFYYLVSFSFASIGSLIYVGSNTPYAFIFTSFILILGMSIKTETNYKKDAVVLTLLYLLNYQNVFLFPSYFIVKAYIHYKNKKLINFNILSYLLLLIVVVSSFIFFKYRAVKTGSHSEIGVNWNTGLSNEFIFESEKGLFKELIDFIITTPKSIAYHINESFFNSNLLGYLILFITISQLYLFLKGKNKNEIPVNIFIYSNFFVFLILVVSGKTVFGPTRHTLYLLPVFLTLLYFIRVSNKKIKKYLWPSVCLIFMVFSVTTILSRQNNFFKKIENISTFLKNKEDYDIVLTSCTYQPFISKSFRKTIKNKKVYFFCGGRLQSINSNLDNKNKLLVIDHTGQNPVSLARELNKRSKADLYNANDFKLIDKSLVLDFNMEQKDFTQLERNTGLYLWEIENKL